MNYGGPDRQENRQNLLDAVDSVRETIITGAEQAEAEMTIPPASINALYDSGLFSLKLPEVLGGAEADPITQMEVLEALALYDSSASWCVMIGATSIGSPGAFLPDEGIQEVFRPDSQGRRRWSAHRSGHARRGGLSSHGSLALRQRDSTL